MLNTSWSIETESSTTTTTSVCGLKYVPGLTTNSSSSTAWLGVPSRVTGRILLPEVLELSELAFDLRIDVERLLALPRATLVAGDDELADLLAKLRVSGHIGRRRLLGPQAGELRFDVHRRLAAGALAIGLRLQQLSQLVLGDGGGVGPGAGVGQRPAVVGLEVDREVALADLLEGIAGVGDEGDRGDRNRDQDDDQDHVSVGER